MTEPCITKYKDTGDKYLFEICHCGHMKYSDHRSGMLWGYYECEECECPKYKELGKFTYVQWMNLPRCDKDDHV